MLEEDKTTLEQESIAHKQELANCKRELKCAKESSDYWKDKAEEWYSELEDIAPEEDVRLHNNYLSERNYILRLDLADAERERDVEQQRFHEEHDNLTRVIKELREQQESLESEIKSLCLHQASI